MNAPRHILVVDDERDIVDLLAFNLRRAGYDVATALTGREALAALARRAPDLVILDVMLPQFSGVEIAQRIRTDPSLRQVPILMLSAKASEADQLVGLSSGADDYVTKPFSVKLLLARVESILRRTGAPAGGEGAASLGPIRMDPGTFEALVADHPLPLTRTEFRLLWALLHARGRVLSRADLIAQAIGPGVTVTERTIDVHMTSVRRKLGEAAAFIHTVRGVGYRAAEPDARPRRAT
ncbi:MAG: response regulator transcription factor [Phycisphaerae bacterium]|nr:response regulator transcription factor [Phycisphaerae bacterium]